MLLPAAAALALALGTPVALPARPAPVGPITAIPRPLPMPGCPGANATVVLRCGPPMPTRGAVTVVVHECGSRIASIYAPGPDDRPVKKAGVVVVHKPRFEGNPDRWVGKGFSLTIVGTHPTPDGRDLAQLDTTLLGGAKSLQLACQ